MSELRQLIDQIAAAASEWGAICNEEIPASQEAMHAAEVELKRAKLVLENHICGRGPQSVGAPATDFSRTIHIDWTSEGQCRIDVRASLGSQIDFDELREALQPLRSMLQFLRDGQKDPLARYRSKPTAEL